ncbi:hypothetical protein MNV49_004408 [Pseudohyphozyma bogoriensis]|nr:hypothetical protein MNV49_004408 [Pseudohyphozyma bogoriensis]
MPGLDNLPPIPSSAQTSSTDSNSHSSGLARQPFAPPSISSTASTSTPSVVTKFKMRGESQLGDAGAAAGGGATTTTELGGGTDANDKLWLTQKKSKGLDWLKKKSHSQQQATTTTTAPAPPSSQGSHDPPPLPARFSLDHQQDSHASKLKKSGSVGSTKSKSGKKDGGRSSRRASPGDQLRASPPSHDEDEDAFNIESFRLPRNAFEDRSSEPEEYEEYDVAVKGDDGEFEQSQDVAGWDDAGWDEDDARLGGGEERSEHEDEVDGAGGNSSDGGDLAVKKSRKRGRSSERGGRPEKRQELAHGHSVHQHKSHQHLRPPTPTPKHHLPPRQSTVPQSDDSHSTDEEPRQPDYIPTQINPLGTIAERYPDETLPHRHHAQLRLNALGPGGNKWEGATFEEWKAGGEDLKKRFSELMDRAVALVMKKAERVVQVQQGVDAHKAELTKRQDLIDRTTDNVQRWASGVWGDGATGGGSGST